MTRKKPGCGTHNPLPYPPSPVKSKGTNRDPQFRELWSGGWALTWGPPGGGRWWCWRRGRGLALVGWRRGCPAGGRSMRGRGPAGGPGAAGLGEPRADGPACGSASSPGAASSESGSPAAPEGRAPEEHGARNPGGGSGGARAAGDPPRARGGAPVTPPLPPPHPASPSPAATVRGAERGHERRASAPPPSMRILWIGKGAGWGGRVETVSGSWSAQVLLCAD